MPSPAGQPGRVHAEPPRPCVLVVDDSKTRRYLSVMLLHRQGFEVLEAATGTQALELLQRRPALVVLDVRLPDADGTELCRLIKADPDSRDIPVVLTSASEWGDAAREHGLRQGADVYLGRFELTELVPVVRRLLAARPGHRHA